MIWQFTVYDANTQSNLNSILMLRARLRYVNAHHYQHQSEQTYHKSNNQFLNLKERTLENKLIRNGTRAYVDRPTDHSTFWPHVKWYWIDVYMRYSHPKTNTHTHTSHKYGLIHQITQQDDENIQPEIRWSITIHVRLMALNWLKMRLTANKINNKNWTNYRLKRPNHTHARTHTQWFWENRNKNKIK